MRMLALIPAALALSACIGPTEFESTPVEVDTPTGPVTCQLYGQNQVIWDRALTRPRSMTDAEANEICRATGQLLVPR